MTAEWPNPKGQDWYRYGLTTEAVAEMSEEQGDRCASCGRHATQVEVSRGGRPRRDGTATRRPRALQVDHCHTTDAVRKMLCGRCNLIIGLAQDDPEFLVACAEYLRACADGRAFIPLTDAMLYGQMEDDWTVPVVPVVPVGFVDPDPDPQARLTRRRREREVLWGPPDD